MVVASFILLMHNKPNMTLECIETLETSLESYKNKEDVEIILVDNGSEAENERRVRDGISRHVKYIKLQDNLGYCFGINKGLSEATGDIITVLNNDLIFVNGWFELVLQGIYRDGYGLVAPMLSKCEGEQNLNLSLKKDEIKAYGLQYMKQFKVNQQVCKVIGACMTMTKRTFNTLGGLDYWFSLGHYDDDDYCHRAKLGGIRIGLIKQAFVYHIGSGTFKEKEKWQQEIIAANRNKYMCKYGYHWRHDQLIHVPVKEKDFNGLKIDKEEEELWVADWSFNSSQWRKRIGERDPSRRIAVWIPSAYYTDEERQSVKEIVGKNNVRYFYESIYAKDLMTFCQSFHSVAAIDNDFINKTFRYMFDVGSTNEKEISSIK